MWLSRLFPIPFPSDEFPRVTKISRYISEWGKREGEQAANKVFAVAAVHKGIKGACPYDIQNKFRISLTPPLFTYKYQLILFL